MPLEKIQNEIVPILQIDLPYVRQDHSNRLSKEFVRLEKKQSSLFNLDIDLEQNRRQILHIVYSNYAILETF